MKYLESKLVSSNQTSLAGKSQSKGNSKKQLESTPGMATDELVTPSDRESVKHVVDFPLQVQPAFEEEKLAEQELQ